MTVAAAAVLLAGCTGPADRPPGGDEPSSASGAEPTTGASPARSPATLPEEQLLRAFELTPSDEDLTAQVRAFQEAVAHCMNEAGFEYVPDVPNASDQTTHDTSPSPAPGEEEDWAATWGFGISIDTSPLYADASPEVPDPNADYVASLSEAGRQAYDDALWGTLEEGRQPTGKPGELGCYVESYGDVPENPSPPVPDLVTELQTQAHLAYYDRLGTDPRVADAVAALEDCAADAGATDYDPYAESGITLGFGDQMVSPPYTSWSAGQQVATAWEELTAGGEPDAGDLERFQQWERDMAVAERRCNAPVLALEQQISADVLREVVGPHRAKLEDLLSTWPNG